MQDLKNYFVQNVDVNKIIDVLQSNGCEVNWNGFTNYFKFKKGHDRIYYRFNYFAKDKSSCDTTPNGIFHSKQGINGKFSFLISRMPDLSIKITFNASYNTVSGLSIYDSCDFYGVDDFINYAKDIINKLPKNKYGNYVY